MEINTFISKIKKEDRRFLRRVRFVLILSSLALFLKSLDIIRYVFYGNRNEDLGALIISSVVGLTIFIICINLYRNYKKIDYSLSTYQLLSEIRKRYNKNLYRLIIIFLFYLPEAIANFLDSEISTFDIIIWLLLLFVFVPIYLFKYNKVRNNANQLLKELNAD